MDFSTIFFWKILHFFALKDSEIFPGIISRRGNFYFLALVFPHFFIYYNLCNPDVQNKRIYLNLYFFLDLLFYRQLILGRPKLKRKGDFMDNPITLTVRGFRDAAARERWFRAEVAALGTTGVARTTAEEILGLSRRFVRLEARFQKLFSGAGMQWNVGTLIMGDHTGPMPPWRRNALSRFPSLIREGDAILVELCSTVSAEMARTGKSA